MLRKAFLKKYLKSLHRKRVFYTNQSEFNKIDNPEYVLYFVHGFGGSPGQLKLVWPVIQKVLGDSVYAKCLSIPEFNVEIPVWETNTLENFTKKKHQLISDLKELNKNFPNKKIHVIASSHGMYDFLYTYHDIQKEIKDRLILYWVSCAPDEYRKLDKRYSNITKYLYFLNGFVQNGYHWKFSPSHSILKWLNPECSTCFKFNQNGHYQVFYKREIEFRFRKYFLEWGHPSSIDNLSDVIQLQLKDINGPISDLKCYVLVGLQDGYWDEILKEQVDKLVGKYFNKYEIVYKNTSHLWVVTPKCAEDFLAYSFLGKKEYVENETGEYKF